MGIIGGVGFGLNELGNFWGSLSQVLVKIGIYRVEVEGLAVLALGGKIGTFDGWMI